jgi:hypothetical protein
MTSRAGKRLCDDAGRVGLDGARAQMVLQAVAGGGFRGQTRSGRGIYSADAMCRQRMKEVAK